MSTEYFPHDSFFKKSMQNLNVAKDFFALHLPKEVQKQINLDTIAFEKTSFITDRAKTSNKKQEQRVDMLYSVKVNGEEGYIYLLSEQQSTPDSKMPLRIMRYILEIIQYHFDKKQKGKNGYVPIIWPLIFYNGNEPYNLNTSFLGMYPSGHRALAEKILTSPFQLIELNKIEDNDLRDHVWAAIMELSMQANGFVSQPLS